MHNVVIHQASWSLTTTKRVQCLSPSTLLFYNCFHDDAHKTLFHTTAVISDTALESFSRWNWRALMATPKPRL